MTDSNLPTPTRADVRSLFSWAKQVSAKLNEYIKVGPAFIYDPVCSTVVPTSATIDSAFEVDFLSRIEGNGSLIVTGIGFEGGVHVGLNGKDFGVLSDADITDEILYEIQVDNLVRGQNTFQIWSDSDEGRLIRFEVWRNFTKNEVDTAGTTADWGSVTGAGKPDDNADVTGDNTADDVNVGGGRNVAEAGADVTALHTLLKQTLAFHDNLKISNTFTSPTVTADSLALQDSSNSSVIVSSVNVSPDITSSGANGLDTGSESNSTWYHIWVIYNSSSDTTAGLLSESESSPTMPSGYTFKGYVGAVFNRSSGNLRGIRQTNTFVQTSTFGDVSAGTESTVTSFSISVPTTAKKWRGDITINTDTNGDGNVFIFPASSGVSGHQLEVDGGNASVVMRTMFTIPIHTEQTLWYRLVTGDSTTINTLGWEF